MDILDMLKVKQQEHALSPRNFRYLGQGDAVKDFNCWSKAWNREFKEVLRPQPAK
jgi:hypothetical protein